MRPLHKLTIKDIEKIQPSMKIGFEKIKSDGGGLYLLARRTQSGEVSRFFMFLRQDRGIKKRLGQFPQTTLKEARELANHERAKLDGLKDKKGYSITFKEAYDSFIKHYIEINHLTEGTIKNIQSIYNNHLSKLDNLKIGEISKSTIVKILDGLRGHEPRAGYLLTILTNFFKHAIQNDLLKDNIASQIDLKSVMGKTHSIKHAPHLDTMEKVRELKDKILNQDFNLLAKRCLLLQLYTAVRPAEAREAQWNEFDLEKGIWYIPAQRMKMKEEFIVPYHRKYYFF